MILLVSVGVGAIILSAYLTVAAIPTHATSQFAAGYAGFVIGFTLVWWSLPPLIREWLMPHDAPPELVDMLRFMSRISPMHRSHRHIYHCILAIDDAPIVGMGRTEFTMWGCTCRRVEVFPVSNWALCPASYRAHIHGRIATMGFSIDTLVEQLSAYEKQPHHADAMPVIDVSATNDHLF